MSQHAQASNNNNPHQHHDDHHHHQYHQRPYALAPGQQRRPGHPDDSSSASSNTNSSDSSSTNSSTAVSAASAAATSAATDISALLERQGSISRSNRAAAAAITSRSQPSAAQRRPIQSPSPVHTTHNPTSSPSWSDQKHSPSTLAGPGPLFATNLPPQSQSPASKHHITERTAAPSTPIGRPRAASGRQGADQAFEEVKAVASRDALLEQAVKSRKQPPKTSVPASPQSAHSPLSPRLPAPAPAPAPASAPAPTPSSRKMIRPDIQTATHRTVSIDSTTSSLSSATSRLPKQASSPSLTSAQDTTSPQDIAALIAASGSPEEAIRKLLQEKQSAASHNDQLWRLVEKQRTILFGLNKDLERALKDKEKYRKKLKEQLDKSALLQPLSASTLREIINSPRDNSQSPVLLSTKDDRAVPDHALSARKDSGDTTDVSSVDDMASRSSTPQQQHSPQLPEAGMLFAERPSLPPLMVDQANTRLPFAPASSSSLQNVSTPDFRYPNGTSDSTTPKLHGAPYSPHSPHERYVSGASPVMTSPQSFSSPKDRSTPTARKAPPAPLDLVQQAASGHEYGSVLPSESSHEGTSADEARLARGRQKTREADDRYREKLAMREHATHSQAGLLKRSKSASAPPTPGLITSMDPDPDSHSRVVHAQDSPQEPQLTDTDACIPHVTEIRNPVRHRGSDPGAAPKRVTIASGLMSPGLPMSPRPGDRPLNSPMPRAPKQSLATIPNSPRAGGLPLSPRAPRGPLPPQTPMSFAPSHLARSETYQQLATPSIADRLGVPLQQGHEADQVTNGPRSPGEVYRGLASDQFPGLLLPPNALPSIYVKVDSSRMRPSRTSYMAPRQGEENPIFTLAIHAHSDHQQLWRVEKTLAALYVFDQQIKSASAFRAKLPDRSLFTGHAPARIDARRAALGAYMESLLNTPMDDKAAVIICGFLTADAIPAESTGYFPDSPEAPRTIDVPSQGRVRKDGYLTKRGKNFGGWKARYFVLDGPQLKYYEAPGGALLGSIRLPNAQIGKQSQNTSAQNDDDVDNQYRHAFLVLEPKKKDHNAHVRHVLCAESDDERDAWVECLLQYVDEDVDSSRSSQSFRRPQDPIAGARSPLLQKSMTDVSRPSSNGKDSVQSGQAALRAVPYSNTVAAEAPLMGTTATQENNRTPSPASSATLTVPDGEDNSGSSYPVISGPTNGAVIQNAEMWGMRPTPTPTQVKDKKRSIFGFRARAGSDSTPSGAPLTPNPQAERPTNVRPVFGMPIAESAEFAAPVDVPVHLPAVVYRCIDYLRVKNAIFEEGLFRISGSNITIKALRERFNTEGDINLVTDDTFYDINAVASLLKLYLRELPANVLTRELSNDFFRVLDLPSERQKVDACHVLVNRLPRANRELLEALFAFLREMVDMEEANKMNVRNVGIVFAPTLNLPAPLVVLFVEKHEHIFMTPVDISVPEATSEPRGPTDTDAVRSPRNQMFSGDAAASQGPVEAGNQQLQYQQLLAQRGAFDAGFNANQPNRYLNIGDGDSVTPNSPSPPVMTFGGQLSSKATSRQAKRESSALLMNNALFGGARQPVLAQVEEQDGMGEKF